MKSFFSLSQWSLLLVTTLTCSLIALLELRRLNEVQSRLVPPLLVHLP